MPRTVAARYQTPPPRMHPTHDIALKCAACAAAIFFGAQHASAQQPRARFRSGAPSLRPVTTVQEQPPKPPGQFNPDPGGVDPLDPGSPLLFPKEPVLPGSPQMPRGAVFGRDPIRKTFTYPTYPPGREGLGPLPHTEAVPNRWQIPLPQWQRYRDPTTETPYMYGAPKLWHPYQQSKLKGDLPIIGQDIFLNLTAKNFSLFEARKLPVPSGVSTATPNSPEFFGRSEQMMASNDASFSFDLFQGETTFKPVHWLVRVNAVYNNTWTRVRERNLLNPDPRGTNVPNTPAPNTAALGTSPAVPGDVNPQLGDPGGFAGDVNPGDISNFIAPQLTPTPAATPAATVTNGANAALGTATHYTNRHTEFWALQEAFGELHIGDISENYDFISARVGTQPFVSDFRGFIFADTNLGARIFGSHDNNRTQYNLAYFNMREKDTFSDLNTTDSRHQHVLIANVYRQDFLWKGYTAQLSFHMNLDQGGTHYDKNGFLTRPLTLGTVPDVAGGVRGHDVKAYYLGWAGDGHIGRLNITHAFYQVLGEDDFSNVAGRKVQINAQMAALELSYDRDWYRLKFSAFYASGDSNPTDKVARGFDTILDNPSFIGGPFSWYAHEGINLAGTSVNLKQRDSLVPNLRTSKSEGQSNFVNPGALILGVGADFDVTPKLKAFLNVNYIWLAETAPVKFALQTDKAHNDLGLDASFGFRYRPLLNENIIISAGMGFFVPGRGYRDIYRTNTAPVPGFGSQSAGKVDDFLYNGFLTVTFRY